MDGSDCGVNGCAREVGHIGDHRRDPSKSRAAYMREYRAKRKKGPIIPAGVLIDGLAEAQRENARLTDEVARLKRELAARPIGDPEQDARVRKALSHPTIPFQAFRPVPKPSQRRK